MSTINAVLCTGIMWCCIWRLNRIDLAAARSHPAQSRALTRACTVLRVQYTGLVGAALLSALWPLNSSPPDFGAVVLAGAVLLHQALGMSRWMRALQPDPASDWSGLDSLIHPRPPEH
jgi:drug/metabolite transporter (DMT)-like permease